MASESTPMPLTSSTKPNSYWAKQLYDSRSASYDTSWHPRFAAHMVAQLPLRPGNRVLDIAAGTGLATYAAGERVAPGGTVLGVDLSGGMLRVAEGKRAEWAGRGGEGVRFVEHDVMELERLGELEGAEGTFDGVVCASALVLMRDAGRAVEGWARYLRGGGRMVVDVPHPLNVAGSWILEKVAGRIGVEVGFDRGWIEDEKSVVKLLEGTGVLEVERCEFVEQAGFGRRMLEGSREEALRRVEGIEKAVDTRGDERLRERLREEFVREWMRVGREEGGVEEVDGVWVAVARKKEKSID